MRYSERLLLFLALISNDTTEPLVGLYDRNKSSAERGKDLGDSLDVLNESLTDFGFEVLSDFTISRCGMRDNRSVGTL